MPAVACQQPRASSIAFQSPRPLSDLGSTRPRPPQPNRPSTLNPLALTGAHTPRLPGPAPQLNPAPVLLRSHRGCAFSQRHRARFGSATQPATTPQQGPPAGALTFSHPLSLSPSQSSPETSLPTSLFSQLLREKFASGVEQTVNTSHHSLPDQPPAPQPYLPPRWPDELSQTRRQNGTDALRARR